MIRVGIETATSHGSVAVGRDDRVLAEVVLGVQTRHAERALPALASALELAGVARADVDAVVVGGGPGSFTGVRVAGATAKGLATALEVPLLAYPSLLALAATVPASGPVCALFDARRGEVYAGCWRVGPDALVELMAPRVGLAADMVAATGTAGDGATLFVGEGALRYRAELVDAGARVAAVPAAPRASALLWLAHHHPATGEVRDLAGWEPGYVRGSSAERGVKG